MLIDIPVPDPWGDCSQCLLRHKCGFWTKGGIKFKCLLRHFSVENMRKPTPEESKSVHEYVESISTETGIVFDDDHTDPIAWMSLPEPYKGGDVPDTNVGNKPDRHGEKSKQEGGDKMNLQEIVEALEDYISVSDTAYKECLQKARDAVAELKSWSTEVPSDAVEELDELSKDMTSKFGVALRAAVYTLKLINKTQQEDVCEACMVHYDK